MCLPMAADDPTRILGQGKHLGFEWMVLHNCFAARCGYVRVMPGHPWHGNDYDEVLDSNGDHPDCHGGLTFASADQACDKPGHDDGWWLGFDCAHAGDAADPDLPGYRRGHYDYGDRICGQAYVESHCKSLCEQAKASLASPA